MGGDFEVVLIDRFLRCGWKGVQPSVGMTRFFVCWWGECFFVRGIGGEVLTGGRRREVNITHMFYFVKGWSGGNLW